MTRFLPIVSAILLLLTCRNEHSFTHSEPLAPQEFTDAQGNKMTSPGGWPKCWMSSRLSSVQAAIVAGETPQGWSPDFLYPQGLRHEFEGEIQNPNIKGKCTLNWFGKDSDNANEPWINNHSNNRTTQGIQQQYAQGFSAALTCTADPTPDCHCITVIPSNPGNNTGFGVGLCVRKTPGTLPERPKAGEQFQLFNYAQPDPSLPIKEAQGRCDSARQNLNDLYAQQLNDIYQQQSDDKLTINGNACHLDIEPFTAKPEEEAWYGNAIRDWAVITCTSNDCRCFGTLTKSGLVHDARSKWITYDSCVICGTGGGKTSCTSAKL